MTYLETINYVLRRLREDEVSTYNENSLSLLIGDFVNQAKEEVENAWNWTTLRSVVTVTTAASTSQYTVTGGGDSYTILDVWDNTEDNVLKPMNRNNLRRQQQTDGDTINKLQYYAMDGQDSSRDPYVQFWPVPDGVYSVDFTMKIPQGDIAAGATEITVPALPVKLRALALAISERGEDGGQSFTEVDAHYLHALGDAISLDGALVADEFILEVI